MINWGFIGCGDVVEKKSGAPFRWENKSEIRAVMCRSMERAEDFAGRHRIPAWYDDVEKLLGDPKVDAIYIATPPSTHIPYAVKALKAGKPVYIEKPLGISPEECEDLLALVKTTGVPAFAAYYRRALPYFQTMKKLLDDRCIGAIRTVTVCQHSMPPKDGALTWRRIPDISGGGLFHDVGCHTLDILDYLISPIAEVSGLSRNQRRFFESDDTVTASFEFENGVLGAGTWCYDTCESVDRVEIIGDKGKLNFPVFGHEFVLTVDGQAQTMDFTHPMFIQEPMIHSVIETLLGEGEALCPIETALRTVRVMEKICRK